MVHRQWYVLYTRQRNGESRRYHGLNLTIIILRCELMKSQLFGLTDGQKIVPRLFRTRKEWKTRDLTVRFSEWPCIDMNLFCNLCAESMQMLPWNILQSLGTPFRGQPMCPRNERYFTERYVKICRLYQSGTRFNYDIEWYFCRCFNIY